MLLKIESITSLAGCSNTEIVGGKSISDTLYPPVNRGYCGNSSFWEFCGHNRKVVTTVPLTRDSTDGKCTHIRHFHSTKKTKIWHFTLTTKRKQASKPTPHPKYSPRGDEVWNVTLSNLCSPWLMLTVQQRRQVSGKFRRSVLITAPSWITHY